MKTVPVVLKTLLIAFALTAAPVLAQGGTEGGSSVNGNQIPYPITIPGIGGSWR